jgi:hypothetical protein
MPSGMFQNISYTYQRFPIYIQICVDMIYESLVKQPLSSPGELQC